jgi:protein-disulfide isomerase
MSPVSGNPKGDVTVVVFFDYACGYCKKSVPELDALAAKDPNLRIVYKEFPILGPRSQVRRARRPSPPTARVNTPPFTTHSFRSAV